MDRHAYAVIYTGIAHGRYPLYWCTVAVSVTALRWWAYGTFAMAVMKVNRGPHPDYIIMSRLWGTMKNVDSISLAAIVASS